MRGIPADNVEEVGGFGITPAHAGNTQAAKKIIDKSWDHPRACGEYMLAASWLIVVMGSPPRMRGIQNHSDCL